jgi:hypothetical protein
MIAEFNCPAAVSPRVMVCNAAVALKPLRKVQGIK